MVGSIVLLTPAADWLRIPQPVLLTIFGLALALAPGTPQLHFDPELIPPVVLPPLLFAATQRATVREFRDHAGHRGTAGPGSDISAAGRPSHSLRAYRSPAQPAARFVQRIL